MEWKAKISQSKYIGSDPQLVVALTSMERCWFTPPADRAHRPYLSKNVSCWVWYVPVGPFSPSLQVVTSPFSCHALVVSLFPLSNAVWLLSLLNATPVSPLRSFKASLFLLKVFLHTPVILLPPSLPLPCHLTALPLDNGILALPLPPACYQSVQPEKEQLITKVFPTARRLEDGRCCKDLKYTHTHGLCGNWFFSYIISSH